MPLNWLSDGQRGRGLTANVSRSFAASMKLGFRLYFFLAAFDKTAQSACNVQLRQLNFNKRPIMFPRAHLNVPVMSTC